MPSGFSVTQGGSTQGVARLWHSLWHGNPFPSCHFRHCRSPCINIPPAFCADLKCDNVMLSLNTRDMVTTAKITDFGLAVALDPEVRGGVHECGRGHHRP